MSIPLVSFPWDTEVVYADMAITVFFLGFIGIVGLVVTIHRANRVKNPDTPEDTRIGLIISFTALGLLALSAVFGAWLTIPVSVLLAGFIVFGAIYQVWEVIRYAFFGGSKPGTSSSKQQKGRTKPYQKR